MYKRNFALKLRPHLEHQLQLPTLSDTQAARSPCSCLGWGDHNIILENRVAKHLRARVRYMANPCLYWHTLMANKTCSVRFLTQTQYHPIPSQNSIPYFTYIYICIQLLYIYIYVRVCNYPQLVTSSHLPIAVRPLSARHVGRKAASAWCKTRWGFWTCWLSCCLKSRDIFEWVENWVLANFRC